MINHILFPNQLSQVIRFVFASGSVEILRLIPQTGRNKICWVYFQGRFGLRATFISVRELTRAYFCWLSTLNLLAIKLSEKKAIAQTNFSLLNVGDTVSHVLQNNLGVIVQKDTNDANRYQLPTVLVDWGNNLPIPEQTLFLEAF